MRREKHKRYRVSFYKWNPRSKKYIVRGTVDVSDFLGGATSILAKAFQHAPKRCLGASRYKIEEIR